MKKKESIEKVLVKVFVIYEVYLLEVNIKLINAIGSFFRNISPKLCS